MISAAYLFAGILIGVGLMLVFKRPIPVAICCPMCGTKHIDTPRGDWKNPPHRTHQCGYCTYRWRTADVPTTGVYLVKTKGKFDDTFADEAQGKAVLARRVLPPNYKLVHTDTGRFKSNATYLNEKQIKDYS